MTDREQPRTTVVVAAWDRYVGPRLIEALDSISGQSRPARVVVVDNASGVALPPLPGAEVTRSDTRLSLGAARNLGLAAVVTANVIFWDADDVMTPGTLALLEDELARDPRLVAFGAAIVELPSGRRHRWPRRWVARLIKRPRLFAVLNSVWSMLPTTGSTIMRTDVVRACGGYMDANGGEDWCLGAALAFRGRTGWSERPGRLYLQHEGSAWDAHSAVRHQFEHAAAVRARLARDDAVPRWLRASLPLVALAQWAAIGLHLAVAWIRAKAQVAVERGTGADEDQGNVTAPR